MTRQELGIQGWFRTLRGWRAWAWALRGSTRMVAAQCLQNTVGNAFVLEFSVLLDSSGDEDETEPFLDTQGHTCTTCTL